MLDFANFYSICRNKAQVGPYSDEQCVVSRIEEKKEGEQESVRDYVIRRKRGEVKVTDVFTM